MACHVGHINAVGVAALGTEPAVNAMAGLELVLALSLSLIAGAWLHRLAWVGMAYNLWLWSTVGGLGGPYTIGVTDPGTTIVYVLAFALVLLTHAWRPLSLFQGGPTQKPDHWKLRLGEIAFALLRAFDAYWKWQPEFLLHGVNNLIAAQAGQPAWIVAYIGFFIRAIELVGPVIFGVSVALVESAIAMALLAGVALQWICRWARFTALYCGPLAKVGEAPMLQALPATKATCLAQASSTCCYF